VRRARILTNNPQKLVPLYGLEVTERIPIEVPPREENRDYLNTKRKKLGHLLTVVDGKKR
jgi:3,4-dihydroxy 2-butanone 4-phosphate synthase/GTP cyclohydrolase II